MDSKCSFDAIVMPKNLIIIVQFPLKATGFSLNFGYFGENLCQNQVRTL